MIPDAPGLSLEIRRKHDGNVSAMAYAAVDLGGADQSEATGRYRAPPRGESDSPEDRKERILLNDDQRRRELSKARFSDGKR